MTQVAAPANQVRSERSFHRPTESASILLDALRGFAAFSVFLYHWRDAYFVAARDLHSPSLLVMIAYILTSLGPQCVIVFFVLSGYLVGGNVLRSMAGGRWSWKSYLFTRCTRLYVVLIPALLLGAAFDSAGMRVAGAGPLYSNLGGMEGPFSSYFTLSPQCFFTNLLFLQNVRPIGMGPFDSRHTILSVFGSNGPLWSLSNEFWYYLAFPVLLLAISKSTSWPRRILYVLLFVIWFWFVGYSLAFLGILWLLGAALYAVSKRWQPHASGEALFLACPALFLCMIWFMGYPQNVAYMITGASTAIVILAILYSGAMQLPAWLRWLAPKAAHSSYTLYCVHLPALLFIRAALHQPKLEATWRGLWIALGEFMAVFVYAQAVYFLFEKRTGTIRRRLRPYFTGAAN
jgi:peptidoglycan/LPS O-acetylase OafA/YrhL